MATAVSKEVDVWAKARKAADDLYDLRDTFFPQKPDDKTSKLLQESDLALKLLDSIPAEQRKLPVQRATYEYLRGKILDVLPDYRKEAEDHLSKAVKLNPSLADAWLCLGNFIWKKGDLPSAKNCFNLALSKGPNKKILCQLSMLERRMAQDVENQAEMVEESIQHAKDAITLDVKDGNSWYNLGNACLTSFFVTGTWDHSKLMQSLKAYQNAGHSRAKRLASLASRTGDVNWNSLYKRATLDVLSEGLNKAVAVLGKVLLFVKHENITPLYFLVCDSNQSCFVLTVYGIRNDAIKEGDEVILLEPYFRHVDFSWKGKCYQFRSIRVDFLEQLLINGKALPPHQAIATSIYAQHKP
ncbi:hypothetical protein DITRI_Ditri17bG0049300 [Diplodiscus trichospermus]